MDLRLGQSGSMVKGFLQGELSEARLGLCPGARAHLDRFRTLLRGFYAAKFGYYPPPSVDPRTTIFEANVLRAMRTDFEALYEYLVDSKFDVSQDTPFLATGGICTLQSIQSFEGRYKLQTLAHPLPLMPSVALSRPTRWTWVGERLRVSQNRRGAAHLALLKATNQSQREIIDNELVKAYRRFEEDCTCSPTKADRRENLGPVDARKVRWILVYSMYQALRRATESPPEVSNADGVPYNLCISTANLPPWSGQPPLGLILRNRSGCFNHNLSTSTMDWKSSDAAAPTPQGRPEIRPDIDYFAISRRDTTAFENCPSSIGAGVAGGSNRRSRHSRELARASTFRLSWGLLARQQQSEEAPPTRQVIKRRSLYQEIVVHGYGNGTKLARITSEESPVFVPAPSKPSAVADVMSSASSRYSSDVSGYSRSDIENPGTPNSSVNSGSPVDAHFELPGSKRDSSSCERRRDEKQIGHCAIRRRPLPAHTFTSHEPSSSTSSMPLAQAMQGRQSHSSGGFAPSPLPLNIRKAASTSKSRASAAQTETEAGLLSSSSSSSSFPARSSSLTSPGPTAWDYIKEIMDLKADAGFVDVDANADADADDHKPEWEQYRDLGGLTEPEPAFTNTAAPAVGAASIAPAGAEAQKRLSSCMAHQIYVH